MTNVEIDVAINYLRPVAESTTVGNYSLTLNTVLDAAERLQVAEAERDRYRDAIEEALHHAPKLGELRWRKVDQMIDALLRALNDKEAEK